MAASSSSQECRASGETAGAVSIAWRYRIAGLCGAVLLMGVYWPALTTVYAHFDDYWHIYQSQDNPMPWLHNVLSAHGRPLWGIMIKLAYAGTDQIHDLAYLRLAGLSLLAVFAYALFRLLRNHSQRPGLAALISLLTVLTPATAIYVGWAVFAPVVLAPILMVMAADRFWRAGNRDELMQPVRLTSCSLLLLAALCIYQPAGLFFPVLLFILAVTERGERLRLPELWAGLILTILVCSVYFTIYKGLGNHFFEGDSAYDRAKVSLNIPEIGRFAASVLMPRVIGFWGALQPNPLWTWIWAIASGGLCVCGLWSIRVRFRLSWAATAQLAVLCLFTYGLTFAPNLIATPSAFFRTLAAPYALGVTLAVLGSEWIIQRLAPKSAHIFLPVLSLSAVTVFALQTNHHLSKGFAWPNHHEFRSLQMALKEQFHSFPSSISYIAPEDYLNNPDHPSSKDEFNYLSTGFYKSFHPLVLTVIAWETFGIPPPGQRGYIDVESYSWYEQPEQLPEDLIDGYTAIHGFNPLEQPHETIQHPYFGELMVLPDHWYQSGWMGRFRMANSPYVEHPLYGLFYFFLDSDPYWASHSIYGTVWFSAEQFPLYYNPQTGEWKEFEKLKE